MDNIGIKFISLVALFFGVFLELALLLAYLGFFYASILFLAVILFLGILSYVAWKNWKKFSFNREFLIVASIFLLSTLVFSLFSVPTVFSGRDQGSFSNAAIALSQNHSLKQNFPIQQEFFEIYGPGEALNFPGFSYTQDGDLTPHFPAGYISYLAFFFSLFGLGGFVLANAVSFLIFLTSFYLLSKIYLKPSRSITLSLLLLTSFPLSWIFKYTLSENLALALVWMGVLQLMFFLKNKDRLHLFVFLFLFCFLFFVRVEALAFLIMAGVIFFIKAGNFKNFSEKIFGRNGFLRSDSRTKTGWAIIVLFMLTFLISLKASWPFYITFIKGFFHSFSSSENIPGFGGFFIKIFYVLKVFAAYAILTYLVLGVTAFIYFLKKRNYFTLIPIFIILPAFFYLLSPSITLDHPWFLRRYVFALIPACLLYSVIFLNTFLKRRKYFYLSCFFLLLTNLIVFIPYFSVRKNKDLLAKTKEISATFGPNDLVLVDRFASGNPWAMLAGPLQLLCGKQAVYFFNPDDLEKIDRSRFDKIYFIISNDNLNFYGNSPFLSSLIPIENYSLADYSLDTYFEDKNSLLKNPIVLPTNKKVYTYGKVYLLREK